MVEPSSAPSTFTFTVTPPPPTGSGRPSAQEHLRTYAHVMIDRTELDYAAMSDWSAVRAG